MQWLTEAPKTGTTIVATTYKDGVVVGCDARVSTGNYISNRASDKLTALSDNVYLLRSGSACDTQAIADYVRYFVHQLEMEAGTLPAVATVAHLAVEMNYKNKDHLMGAMIIAGYDDQKGGQVFGAPIGGTVANEKWAIDGSGSTYIWSHCDHEFREGMSREEAERFVIEACALAMSRDASSGGCIRLMTLNKEGAFPRYVQGDRVPLYQDEVDAIGYGMIIG